MNPRPTPAVLPRVPFERYTLELEPLCPVHIGSGQSMLGVEYRFNEGPSGASVAQIDLDRFLGEHDLRTFIESVEGPAPVVPTTPPKMSDFPPTAAGRIQYVEASNAFKKASSGAAASQHPVHKLLAGEGLAEWLRDHIPAEYQFSPIAVGKQTAAELRSVFNNPNAQGEVHLLPRSAGEGAPYLPGSSLKGALRTAVVAAQAANPVKESGLMRAAAGTSSAGFEGIALGHGEAGKPNLYRDPFRQVRLSDLHRVEGGTAIRRVQIVRKPGSAKGDAPDPAGIHMWRECTTATLEGAPSLWRGELRLAHQMASGQHYPVDAKQNPTHLPLALPLGVLLADCNKFYRARLATELKDFRCRGELAQGLQAAAAALGPGECLVRLGRHSHFECVTVGAPFARAYSPRGSGETRSYAERQSPLGWCVLRVVPWRR